MTCAVINGRNCLVTINGSRLMGVSDDKDAVVVEPMRDVSRIQEGMSGASQIVVSGSNLVTVKIKLFANHADNGMLDGLVKQVKAGLCGIEGSVLDVGTGAGGTSSMGTIIAEPVRTYGVEADGVREWTFGFADWDTTGVSFGG